jgi:hypothetical protein
VREFCGNLAIVRELCGEEIKGSMTVDSPAKIPSAMVGIPIFSARRLGDTPDSLINEDRTRLTERRAGKVLLSDGRDLALLEQVEFGHSSDTVLR